MRKIGSYTLTAQEVHTALIDAGFTPLVGIKNATHWTRRERAVIVHTEFPHDTQIEENSVERVLFANFCKLDSGEILVL